MFDKIIYKNSIGPGPLIDIGALAEGLLFYDKVAIVGNSGTLKGLLARIPPFIFLSLLKEGRIEFHYIAEQAGVSNSTINGRSIFSLLKFSAPDPSIEKAGMKVFEDAAGNNSQAKYGARQFINQLRLFDQSGFDQNSVLHAITDTVETEQSVKSIIREIVPNFVVPGDLRFKVERELDGFCVDTNIDFVELNSHYHEVVPAEHSSMTEAYILALIQGAYQATYFAAALDSEVAVHPLERAVQSAAVNAVVKRHAQSQSQLVNFVDLVVPDGHGIREAVNSGAVPFSSVCKILDSADKFRHWLHGQPADANLVRAYYQETVKESWVEKLPGKSMRWSLFAGIGIGIDALGAGGIGTAAAVAISAVDSFLLDKLVKGWKPHQFVEKDLKSLLYKSK